MKDWNLENDTFIQSGQLFSFDPCDRKERYFCLGNHMISSAIWNK